MLSSIVLGLCLAKAILAVPAPLAAPLAAEELLVWSKDGSYERTNYSAWAEKLTYQGVSLTRPEPDNDAVDLTGRDLSHNNIQKRGGCSDSYQYILTKTQTFVDWDVQMSNVVCATGSMDVWVSAGYDVANSVTISQSMGTGTAISEALTITYGIDYSETWTTTSTMQNKGTVEDGRCGVMITKPLVTRRSGIITQGCLGARKQVSTFYADSHGKGSYDGVEWVEGATGMCKKNQTEPPLSRCNGQGNFI